MPIWKEQTPVRKEPVPFTPEAPPASPVMATSGASASEPARRPVARDGKESLIASDITIEGKIEGSGHVRIAGKFKGDVNVQGNVTIEAGAKVTGGVRANTVMIAGELEGNIDGATRVELIETGILNGDVKAGSLIVAAGSRMRGQVEFGWEEKGAPRS